jgi:hypothetical protein
VNPVTDLVVFRVDSLLDRIGRVGLAPDGRLSHHPRMGVDPTIDLVSTGEEAHYSTRSAAFIPAW